MTKLVVAAAVAVLLLPPGLGRAQTPPPAAAGPPAAASQPAPAVRVDGFRGARWGMTEAETKAAIQSEFKIPADRLKPEINQNEKTSVLTISVPELIEGAGIARVAYIFGYTTKKLIQVNITWGTPADPQAKPEMVVAAANQLHQLFIDAGYDPATIVNEVRTSDGALVVFQGQDADKHTTLLRLVTAQVNPDKANPDKDKPDAKPVVTAALFLSYIMDGKSPDIFRLKKGQF